MASTYPVVNSTRNQWYFGANPNFVINDQKEILFTELVMNHMFAICFFSSMLLKIICNHVFSLSHIDAGAFPGRKNMFCDLLNVL